MAEGTDVAYATGDLERGGTTAAATGDAAGAVAVAIAGIAVDAAVFGRVDAVGPLVTELTAFRDGSAALGRAVQAAHDELSGRAGSVVRQGDQLVSDTTARAASVPPPSGSPS